MLRQADVVNGALKLLDQDGLEGLTMRKLGVALGVHAGALYRHYPSKEALLDAMAEKLVEGVADPPPDGPWDQRLMVLANRFRDALLSHRDGARVFAGTFVSSPNTNAIGVAAVDALVSAGLSAERAGWITYAGMYYVLGHTIEEQAQLRLAGRGEDWSSRAAESPPADPTFAEALRSVSTADPADRFTYGFELFLDGVRGAVPLPRPG
ncbi:MAG TPA: TetR/AcrR family transcriptional regulator C-terminal domain-containing protein [Solirubrobacterales bacterium]